MKLSINNKIFTDNTNELEKDNIFVVSKQNEKFKDIAINGGFELLNSSELKNYLDMSSIKIIGVTGTNGKKTTASTIYKIILNSHHLIVYNWFYLSLVKKSRDIF